jgi:hypothetical protein
MAKNNGRNTEFRKGNHRAEEDPPIVFTQIM